MKKEDWISLRIDVSGELSDALANRMMELGSPGIVTEDAVGGKQRLFAHFRRDDWKSARQALEQYIPALRDMFPEYYVGDIFLTPYNEEDWAENWKQYFHPAVVSPRLLVRPPWEEPPDYMGKTPLVIDPGIAFGTGLHATTRLVLRALDDILKDWDRPHPARVLDAGTGSGILAIAAVKLGAGDVTGFDNDPDAVAAAEENLARNGLGDRISLKVCSVSEINGSYDIVLANLTAPLLMKSRKHLSGALAPGGFLAASGLLTTDLPEISECFNHSPLHVVRDEALEEWHLVVWRRQMD